MVAGARVLRVPGREARKAVDAPAGDLEAS